MISRAEISTNDPNLSRLKCIGYKYGYDDVITYNISKLLPFSKIIFIKWLSGDETSDYEIAEYDIEIPIEVIKKYNYTKNFYIIADYVEKDLKNQHEKANTMFKEKEI